MYLNNIFFSSQATFSKYRTQYRPLCTSTVKVVTSTTPYFEKLNKEVEYYRKSLANYDYKIKSLRAREHHQGELEACHLTKEFLIEIRKEICKSEKYRQGLMNLLEYGQAQIKEAKIEIDTIDKYIKGNISPGDFCFIASKLHRERYKLAYDLITKHDKWQDIKDDALTHPPGYCSYKYNAEVLDEFEKLNICEEYILDDVYDHMHKIAQLGWDAYVEGEIFTIKKKHF